MTFVSAEMQNLGHSRKSVGYMHENMVIETALAPPQEYHSCRSLCQLWKLPLAFLTSQVNIYINLLGEKKEDIK